MMFSKGSTALGVWVALLLVWFAGSGGCTTVQRLRPSLRPSRSVLPARPALPSERVARPVDNPRPTKSNHLSNVADFLARTSEYQLAGSPAVYVPKRPPIHSSAPRAMPTPHRRAAGALEPATLSGRADRELRAAVLVNTNSAIDVPVRPEPVLALPVVQAVTVASSATPAPAVAAGPASPASPNVVNQPMSVRDSQPAWSAESVLEHLERQSSKSGDLDGVWPLKFAQLAFHRDGQAAEMPSSLSAETQTILGALMRLVPAIRSVARDSATPGDEALSLVDELRRILADRSDPVVSTIVLCRKVVTYGVYDEIDAAELVAGRENQAIVYSEIRNLRAEETETGRFRSRLATRLEVLTAEGKSVWQHEEPEIVDESRNRRTDFFVAERIALPSTLPAGDYVLKVMVEDKISQRMHEASKPFSLVSTQTASRLSTSPPTP